jgi:hypothetical protein
VSNEYRMLLPDPYIPWQHWLEIFATSTCQSPAAGAMSGSANISFYMEFVPPCDMTVYGLSFVAANGLGNYDIGIYNGSFARMVSSGSVGMSAGHKTLAISNLRLTGGNPYWLALALSLATGQVYRYAAGAASQLVPKTGLESAFPLPATAAPALNTAAGLPLMSLSVR